MFVNINCKSFKHGGYCSNKKVKALLFGFGARVCRLYEGEKSCEHQETTERPAPPKSCCKNCGKCGERK